MRHRVSGRKLKRTASHRKALLANLATSLFEHKRVETTLAKAKELRSVAETMITKAKVALAREKQGLLPDGMKTDVHSRRVVGKVIRKKAVVAELFDAIAPVVESRNGGYTRVIKTGFRRGDAAATAVIELVDWAAPQDGASSMKRKKKKTAPKAQVAKPAAASAPASIVAAQEEFNQEPAIAEEAPAAIVMQEEFVETADVETAASEVTPEPDEDGFKIVGTVKTEETPEVKDEDTPADEKTENNTNE